MCRVFSCGVGIGCFLWPVHSLGKTLLAVWPACTPRPNLPITSGIFWLPTFAFQSPIMKRTFFFCYTITKLFHYSVSSVLRYKIKGRKKNTFLVLIYLKTESLYHLALLSYSSGKHKSGIIFCEFDFCLFVLWNRTDTQDYIQHYIDSWYT